MGKNKKSLLVLAVVAAFMTAGLILPAVAGTAPDGLGPKGLKEAAVSELAAAKTGDSRVDRTINRVISSINKSLTSGYWLDVSHLNRKHGGKVFIYELGAVANMAFRIKLWKRRGPTPDQQQAIDAFSQAIPMLVEA